MNGIDGNGFSPSTDASVLAENQQIAGQLSKAAGAQKAFFAGAHHLFTSIMNVLDPGPDTEPTERDLRRMSQIHAELERYERILKAEVAAAKSGGPAGTA